MKKNNIYCTIIFLLSAKGLITCPTCTHSTQEQPFFVQQQLQEDYLDTQDSIFKELFDSKSEGEL